MAERWGLIVEESRIKSYHNMLTELLTTVLEVFTGSRAEALARLESHATSYQPRRMRFPPRTRLFRTADGFLLVCGDAPSEYDNGYSFVCRFTVAELLRDSEDTRRVAEAEARAQAEVKARLKAEERAAKRRARRGY
ncbi:MULTISPECIES: hypothetical protein [unclassified Streptomyces]|uniref:hypothetical protein n=1 Tax=unclassified Streptomyces TaxID=2593676 RepID=UPI00344DA283